MKHEEESKNDDIYILQWYIPFFKRYDSEQQPVEIIED